MDLNEIVRKYADWDSYLKSGENTVTDKKQLASMKKRFESAKRLTTAAESAKKNTLASMGAGITNDKGNSSLAGSPAIEKATEIYDKFTADPEKTREDFQKIQEKMRNALNEADGKSVEEQKQIAEKYFPTAQNVVSEIAKKQVETSATNGKATEEEKEEEETPKGNAEEKREDFLKSWGATHPTWGQILKSKNLTIGQKAALIGGALAQFGANVTLGAKSGFEHSAFTPSEWDFKKAIDKYSEQEITDALRPQQGAKGKTLAAEYFSDYRKLHGDKATEELLATLDVFGDNPELLKSRLAALGIKEDAATLKSLYSKQEKTTVSEETKRQVLDTEAKRLENKLAAIQNALNNNQLKLSDSGLESLKAAQKAMNEYNTTKFTSDKKTYNLEKIAGYAQNVLHEVEAVGGNIVGIRDGIIRAKGIPQKIVRADGSEVQLDPNDNIYATRNEITGGNDDGGEVVPMTEADPLIYQNRLGYSGGFIRKDFDYYLNRLKEVR